MTEQNPKKYHLRRYIDEIPSPRVLLDSIPEALFITNSEGRIIEANIAACRLLGYEWEELVLSEMTKIAPSYRLKNAIEKFAKLKERGELFEEIILKKKDGTTLDAEMYGAVLKNGYYLATMRDISKRKEMERKLKESEETYRNLVEMSPDAIVVHNEGKVTFVNPAGARLYGIDNPDDLIGKSVIDFVHPESRSLTLKRIAEIMQNKKPVPTAYEKMLRADGSIAHVEVAAAPLQSNSNSTQVVIRDITQRIEMEQELRQKTRELEKQLKALKESKEKYKDLFENANDIIYTTDLEGKILSINKAGTETYGYPREELIGHDLIKLIHPDFINICFDHFFRKLSGKTTGTEPYEVLTLTKNGRKVWVEVNTRLIKKDGKPIGLQSIARDITERKQMIEAIKKAEEEKDLILSSISELVVFYDKDMRIRWANHMVNQKHEIPREEIIGCYCYEVWHNQKSPCPNCPVQVTLETGKRARGEIITSEGEIWQVKSFPVIDSDNSVIGAVKIAKDISERRKMEKEMARLERMNLIGEMAAGFGHEIRNPMAVVKGFLQMLSEKKDLNSYRNYFEIMIDEIDRANSIIAEYLSLAKNKVINLKVQDLNPIIEGLYPLILADALHEDKVLELNLQDIPQITIDKNDIHQLTLNLVRNGLEAMDKGGMMTISTYRQDDEVVLAVRDEGKGIHPAILPKLGMPFITTKENGTGLGLAICYSIAARNNARIEVETSRNGTVFFVRFPVPD